MRIIEMYFGGRRLLMEKKKSSKIKYFIVPLIVFVASILIWKMWPNICSMIKPNNVMQTITTSKLEKAVDINELSTSQFVYGGIAQVYQEDGKTVKYNICYRATVDIGIPMNQITFEIDHDKKTIKPKLRDISINNTSVDPSQISYIPENPDIDLKEVIATCRTDAEKESKKTEDLYKAAEENAKSTIEALLTPITESEEYQIIW
jgi:hypothetical protein